LLFAGLWATPAMAGTYVGVSAGLGLLNDSAAKFVGVTVDNAVGYSAGVPVGVAVGYTSGDYRLEGAAGYQSHNIDTFFGEAVDTNDDVSVLSFMVNGYYDITINDSSVSPYLTAGLGFASITSGDGADSLDESAFAWQVGAGFGFKASENVVIDLGYRYFKTADITIAEFDGGESADLTISGSNILAGVRYNF